MTVHAPGQVSEAAIAGTPLPARLGRDEARVSSASGHASTGGGSLDAEERPAGLAGPAAREWGRVARIAGWPLLAVLWIYRRFVSPVLPPACRFHPSCSLYAAEAIVAHGPIRGTWLAVRRLLRCHPWNAGGPDPVPPPRARVAGSAFADRATR